MLLNSRNSLLPATVRFGRQWSLFIIAVALTLLSCNRRSLYAHYEPIAATGWAQADTLRFTVVPSPVGLSTNPALRTTSHFVPPALLALHLRTTSGYPFTDLSLLVDQRTASQHRLDTLCLQLADSEGRPLGRGQGLYQHTFPLRALPLASDDTLHVAVVHLMQRSPLPGITDVGLSLDLQ